MMTALAALSWLVALAALACVAGVLMRRAGQVGWEIDRVLDDDAAALYRSGWDDEALEAQERETVWSVEDDEALTRLQKEQSS